MAPPMSTMSYRESIGREKAALYLLRPARMFWRTVAEPGLVRDGASRSR